MTVVRAVLPERWAREKAALSEWESTQRGKQAKAVLSRNFSIEGDKK